MPRRWFSIALMFASTSALAIPLRALHLVPNRARVAPGETILFRVEPASTARVTWHVVGPGFVSGTGRYTAPYVVSASGVSSRVVLIYGDQPDVRFSAAELEISPGAFPGANSCLGQGQSWSSTGRGLDYVPVDVLPRPRITVKPAYPPAVEARKLRGTVVADVLVCRTGDVLDAWVSWPEGAVETPELEELALAAARQWVFEPASFQGRPVAVVVAIPFRFPP